MQSLIKNKYKVKKGLKRQPIKIDKLSTNENKISQVAFSSAIQKAVKEVKNTSPRLNGFSSDKSMNNSLAGSLNCSQANSRINSTSNSRNNSRPNSRHHHSIFQAKCLYPWRHKRNKYQLHNLTSKDKKNFHLPLISPISDIELEAKISPTSSANSTTSQNSTNNELPAISPNNEKKENKEIKESSKKFFPKLSKKAKSKRKNNRNSTNRMFVDQTISKFNDREMLRSTAFLIHYKICCSMKIPEYHRVILPAFEFDFHNKKYDSRMFLNIPTKQQIFNFLTSIYKRAQLSSECIIISLAYMERIMKISKVLLTTTNWFSLVYGSYCLASKMWDDLSMNNHDFGLACPIFTLKFEIEYLNYLNYQTEVKSSLYASIYFLLREIYTQTILYSKPNHKKEDFVVQPKVYTPNRAMKVLYGDNNETQTNTPQIIKRAHTINKLPYQNLCSSQIKALNIDFENFSFSPAESEEKNEHNLFEMVFPLNSDFPISHL